MTAQRANRQETHVRLVLPDGDEVPVGTLRPTNVRATQSATFQYHLNYLNDSRAYAIDPELPLVDWPMRTTNRALFRCMSDSTPDRWGRALLNREFNRRERALPNKARSTLEIDFLLGVRDDTREGALRYFDDDGLPLASAIEGVPKLVELEALLGLTDELLLDPTLDIDIRDLVAAGSSLGGARPKASVVDDDGTLLIAKFPNVSSDDWDVSAWEKVVLDLADAAGIVVPRNRVVQVLDRNVLLLERFDRDRDRRIGYLSALTLAGADDGDHSVSYADLAEYFEPIAANPDRDLPQLFRRALFNLAVSNTDNHLRNHGFLRTASGWELSPAFDVNSNPRPASFATAIVPGGNADRDYSQALEWAEHFRVSPTEAAEMTDQIREVVSTWQTRARDLGIPTAEITLMAPAFER